MCDLGLTDNACALLFQHASIGFPDDFDMNDLE
jgi:hypothetical protein